MADTQPDGALWAITSYFNPLRYRQRLANYRVFRRRLGVPLLTVELTFGAAPELNAADADILLQLDGGAVLWQKERLLNVALNSLPRGCREVAWLDCDILFEQADWPARVSAALAQFPLLQPYRQVRHLAPAVESVDATPHNVMFSGPSFAAALAGGHAAAGQLANVTDRRDGTPAPGMAWAARRELLDRHGFYDGCIVGGGDTALACAACGAFDEVMRLHLMNERQRTRYLAWARPFHEAVGGAVGCVDGDLFHLWHGAIDDRKPRQRHAGLAPFDFDPCTDIAVGENGCWQWASDKPQLHRYVHDYFAGRREDGAGGSGGRHA
jgi:hypothetical protein